MAVTQITWDCGTDVHAFNPLLRTLTLMGTLGHGHPSETYRHAWGPSSLAARVVGPCPYPGSQSPSWAIPCCQVYGKLPHPGPCTGRHSSGRAREWGPGDETGHGPRSWSMDTGWMLGVSGPHGARSWAESSLTLLAVLPKSDNGRSRAQDDKQEEGELIRALNPLSQKAPPAPTGHSIPVGQDMASEKRVEQIERVVDIYSLPCIKQIASGKL